MSILVGAHNRTSRPAAQPPKIYLLWPVPTAGVEEVAGVDEAGVEEASAEEVYLFYTGTLPLTLLWKSYSSLSFSLHKPV